MKNIKSENSIYELHCMSIPSIDPIVSRVMIVNTKVLLLFLRIARTGADICHMHSEDIFGLIHNTKDNSKFKQFSSNSVLPLII